VPFDDPTAPDRFRLVYLRDSVEHEAVARRVEASQEMARERGIGVTSVVAEGASPVERLASLVAAVDFATTYLALVLGIDPMSMQPITELKSRIAE